MTEFTNPYDHLFKFKIQNVFGLLAMISISAYGTIHFFGGALNIPVLSLVPLLRWGTVIWAVLYIFSCRVIRKNDLPYLSIWYIVLLLLSLFSILYTINSDLGDNVSNIFAILVLGTSLSFVLKDEKSIRKFLFILAVSGLINFLILSSHNLLHMDDRLGRTLTNGNSNSFAQYIMITMFASLACVLLESRIIYKAFFSMVTALNFYMLLLSGGRKFILVPLLTISVYFLLKTSDRKKTLQRIMIAIAIVAFCVWGWGYIQTNNVLYNAIGWRFAMDAREDSRLDLIRLGFSFWSHSPIWGYGENGYIVLARNHGFNFYSHNNYIELLTNFGLIGFIWYYGYLLRSFFPVLKYSIREKDSFTSLIVAIIVGLFALDLGTVSYCDSSITFIFYIFLFTINREIQRKNCYMEEC